MTNQELSLLARKYLSGTASPEEKARLNEWYNTFSDPLETNAESTRSETHLEKRIQEKLSKIIGQDQLPNYSVLNI